MDLEKYINEKMKSFFKEHNESFNSLKKANDFLESYCGVINFFTKEVELNNIQDFININLKEVGEPNRRAYGDFQTNENLSSKITNKIQQSGFSPEFILEPTCGKGIFLINSLKVFKEVKKLVGIEIYYPYVLETKFKILNLFLENKNKCKPKIEIIHADIFQFSLKELSKTTKELKTLIIGNPPWVTNSELGSINSKNLPKKSNFKNHNGIDAITGKGNFDIGEYISVMILELFHEHNGLIAFLVKNIVVKNILVNQKKRQFKIGTIEKLNIDAKQEFNVSVNACLFQAKLNQKPTFTCIERDFYTNEKQTTFGWYEEKFVHSVEKYQKVKAIDGKCSFVWRQGVKHDCSKIMELNRVNGHFINGLKEEVVLEKDLLYGLLKSSDLKNELINSYRKTTIITQKKVGQDTSFIKRNHPKTFTYLDKNRTAFDKRKSKIYKGKPPFSIFGIGEYSFAKYKVAIAGMYKRTIFSLVLPENDKPLMLDDTCYFIGFDNLKDAQIAQKLLNSSLVQDFLVSIIFKDAKRSITKDILMRIDLAQTAKKYIQNNDWLDSNELNKDVLRDFNEKYLKPVESKQMQIF
ncbi:MAG: hypothetical protein ACPGXZ_08720 [Saprospiraceae bacterium]